MNNQLQGKIAAQFIAEILVGKHIDKTDEQLAQIMRQITSPQPRKISDLIKSKEKPENISGQPSEQLSDLAAAFLNRSMRRKGQFAGFLWVRPLKTLKDVTSVITKEVRCVARIGVEYENLKSTIEGRESGELPAENNGLPWGRWLYYPYLIEHTNKENQYNLYLRIYTNSNNPPKVVYRINGQVARKEEVEPLCRASEFRDHEGSCITLNLNSLRRMR